MDESLQALPPRNIYTITTNLVPIARPAHLQHIYLFHYSIKTFSKLSITAYIQAYLINKIASKYPQMKYAYGRVLMSVRPLAHKEESIKTEFNNIAIEIVIAQRHRFRLSRCTDSRQNRQNLKVINRQFLRLLKGSHYTTTNAASYLPLPSYPQSGKTVCLQSIRHSLKWYNNNLFLQLSHTTKQLAQLTLLDEIKSQMTSLLLLDMPISEIYKQMNRLYHRRQVITLYGANRIYRICLIDFEMNISMECIQEGTQTLSFKSYYKNRYDIAIKDHKQPIIKVNKSTYLIPQLVKLIKLKDTDTTITDLNSMTQSRNALLTTLSNHPAKSNGLFPHFTQLQVELASNYQMLEVDYLDYPDIKVGKDKRIDTFTKNIFQFQDNTVYQSKTGMKIYTICPSNLSHLRIHEQVIIAAQNIGVEIELKLYNYTQKNHAYLMLNDVKALIHQISLAEERHRVIWIIIDDHLSNEYATIKRMTLNNNLEEISQITLVSTLASSKRHYQSILMQMAAKTRAVLWKIPNPMMIKSDTKILMIGLCCSHHIVQQTIITFCWNINSSMTKFCSQFSLSSKQQYALSLKLTDIVERCLKAYHSRNKLYPTEVIIVRKQNLTKNDENIQLGEVRAAQKGIVRSMNSGIGLAYYGINKDKGLQTYWQKDVDRVFGCRNGTIIDEHVVDSNSFYVLYQTSMKGQVNHIYYRNIHKSQSSRLSNSSIAHLMFHQSYNYFNFQGCVYVPGVLKYAIKLSKMVLGIKLDGKLKLQAIANHLYFL